MFVVNFSFKIMRNFVSEIWIIFLFLCYIQTLVMADVEQSIPSSRLTGAPQSQPANLPASQAHTGPPESGRDHDALWMVITTLKDRVQQLEVDRQYDR